MRAFCHDTATGESWRTESCGTQPTAVASTSSASTALMVGRMVHSFMSLFAWLANGVRVAERTAVCTAGLSERAPETGDMRAR